MMISRTIIRKMIIREVKKALSDPKMLAESSLISNLTSDGAPEVVAAKIKKLEDLDKIVTATLSDEKSKKNLKDTIEKLDDKKKAAVIKILGLLRADLPSSTFNNLKKAAGL
jgi:hypothetical protein